jgi:hypothetical protein
MRSSLLLAACLAGATAHALPPAGNVIERVLAVVDRRPILLSEVEVIQTLRRTDRQAALDALVDETLMYAEATRYSHAQPTPAQDAAALDSLKKAVPAAAAISEGDLRRLAHRQATIVKYVQVRFQPLIRVTDEELHEAHAREQQVRGSPVPFEQAAGQLEQRLMRRALDRRMEEWVRQLREAADVRYVVGPSCGPGS